jgi:chromosome partitioning protein
MHTIVLATQKGGSGKSTLAIGLALAAIQAGHTVRLIETDSQGTLSNWQSRRVYAEPIVDPVYIAGEIEQRLQSLSASGVTLAIIDTAGDISAATTAAIRCADLCLIPARPTIADIEATASTLLFYPLQRHAIRLRPQPDADPRPAHQQRGNRALRRGNAR